MIELLNIDCMKYMSTLDDNAFDLAIVDPPYGIKTRCSSVGGGGPAKKGGEIYPPTKFHKKDWDHSSPEVEYFNELRRVSKNQIIWGANHFISKMSIDSSCWIVWDKNNGTNNFADCELAWTSFKTAVRKISYTWDGFRQGPTNRVIEKRIHPTQKPAALYEWLLNKYAKPGQKILDTHLGSGSSALAARHFGVDFVGCEIDEDYYNDAVARFNAI